MHTYQELAQDIPKEYEALKESSHRFAAEGVQLRSNSIGWPIRAM